MNKRYILFASLIFCLLPNCFGQLYIGPKAGLQAFKPFFSSKEDTEDIRLHPKPGINLGIAAVVEVKENFALNFEFAYSQKGKKVRGEFDPVLKHDVTYNHIDIPLLFTRRFNARQGNRAYQWYVNAGPNISYWINGSGSISNSELKGEWSTERLDYEIVFDQPSFDADQSNINHPNRLQLGLNIGGGLIFKPGRNNILMVDFRLEMGSTFVGKKDSSVEFPYQLFAYSDNLRAVNGGLKASVAYLFDMNLSQRKKGKSTKKIKRRR